MDIVHLDNYVNIILNKILANQNLCKYLYYDVDNPLSMPDIVDTSVLSNKNSQDRRIYTIPFNPDVHMTQKSTIHIETSDANVTKNIYYKDIKINFIILVHNYLWELDTEDDSVSLRPNAIVHELSKLFNREKSIGIGKVNYSQMKNIYMNEAVAGYKLSFENIDFTGNM